MRIWDGFFFCFVISFLLPFSAAMAMAGDNAGNRISSIPSRKSSTLKMIIIIIMYSSGDTNFGRRSRTKSIHYTFRLLATHAAFTHHFSNGCFSLFGLSVHFLLFFLFAFGPFIDLDLRASRTRQWKFTHHVRPAAGNLICNNNDQSLSKNIYFKDNGCEDWT